MKTSERVVQLINAADLNVAQISERVEIPEQRLADILDGASPTVQEILRIREAFNVSLEWLMEGDLNSHQSRGFRLVDPEVEAGFVADHTDPEVLSRMEAYFLPGFSESDNLIFKVSGDSMWPTVSDGDYLVCRRIEEFQRVVNSSLAVILLKDKLLVKRVERQKESWLLKSDKQDGEDARVDPKQIRAVWEVIGKVTRAFVESSKYEFLKKLQLQDDLKLLRQDLKDCNTSFSQVRQTLEQKSS